MHVTSTTPPVRFGEKTSKLLAGTALLTVLGGSAYIAKDVFGSDPAPPPVKYTPVYHEGIDPFFQNFRRHGVQVQITSRTEDGDVLSPVEVFKGKVTIGNKTYQATIVNSLSPKRKGREKFESLELVGPGTEKLTVERHFLGVIEHTVSYTNEAGTVYLNRAAGFGKSEIVHTNLIEPLIDDIQAYLTRAKKNNFLPDR